MERIEIQKILERALIIIDKPIGPTSHKTTEYVRKILQVQKAGHSGTLDPKVSGVLPVAIGKATRILEFLLSMPKEYIGVMRLHENVNVAEIRKTIKKSFLGKIKQTPPRKSAVKRQEREREIYSFQILEKDGKDALFKVKCEAGTYIRKLIHDFGEALKVGAHMLELRRVAVGPFKEKDAVTLYALARAAEEAREANNAEIKRMLLPMESAVKHLPKVNLKKSAIEKIKYGQFLSEQHIIKLPNGKEFTFAGFYRNQLVCILKRIMDKNEIKLKPDKVFI